MEVRLVKIVAKGPEKIAMSPTEKSRVSHAMDLDSAYLDAQDCTIWIYAEYNDKHKGGAFKFTVMSHYRFIEENPGEISNTKLLSKAIEAAVGLSWNHFSKGLKQYEIPLSIQELTDHDRKEMTIELLSLYIRGKAAFPDKNPPEFN